MKNKEIEELLNELKRRNERYNYCKNNDISFSDEDYKSYLLLSYIEQLENKCESLLESKNETLRYISNYLTLDQRYKWNDNVDEKLKLVKNILNGREKTITNISYEDLLRQNKQLENNRDKAIELIEEKLKVLYHQPDRTPYENVIKILKGGSDD